MNDEKKNWKSNLLLFQMGRVGSTSVRQAIHNTGLLAVNLHYMYPPIEKGFGIDVEKFLKVHLIEPVKIISITRDPLARTVSQWVRAVLKDPLMHTDPKRASKEIEESRLWVWPLIWWKNNISRYVEKDVLEQMMLLGLPEHKHVVFYTNVGLVLILRNEDLNNYCNVLSTFIGKKATVGHLNKTAGNYKEHREIYLDFVSNIKFSKDVIEAVYQSQYATSAYSKEELDLFRERWSA